MRNKLFNTDMTGRIKKNVFDLSHEKKMSMNMGELVPFFTQEIMPGDKFRVSTEQLMRLSPLIAPMMHRVNVYTHFFFVPNRLVWDEWPDFITGGVDGTAAPVFPTIPLNDANSILMGDGTLADFFGIPKIVAPISAPLPINALPFRAYQMIYNEYFRDQTLCPVVEFSKGELLDPGDEARLLMTRRRSWEKDYFTSALPWPQRGGDIMLPLSRTINEADIHWRPQADTTAAPLTGGVNTLSTIGTDGKIYLHVDSPESNQAIGIKNIDSIDTNPVTGGSGSINDLRTAFHVQAWLERNARAGGRYIEQLLAHFGVRSSDARLQRPEFLGGGVNPIVISEVLSTFGVADNPQGSLSGHGISVGHNNAFTKRFEEHGYVIGVMSVLPRTAYFQGVPRMWLKESKFDFPFPEFANLGEQAIMSNEIYANGNIGSSAIFGYTPRYAEFKFAQSTVHGDFRNTMNFWHMAREFSEADMPALNEDFVTADPTQRVFAVTDPLVHKLYVQILNKVTAVRPLPRFGIPQL